MLLLPVVLFCFLDGQAQVLLKQTDVSVTRGQTKTAWIDCVAEGISDFKSAYIHWYRQIPPKAPERVLYIGSGLALYDDDSYRNKYTSSKKGTNVCTFSVEDINSNDEGTYYCAYWQYHRTSRPQKVFGSGTKLIVSGKLHVIFHTINELISSPASSEILQKRHENQIMYVCLIEKFYPEVIRVTWADEADKEVTDNIVKGDVWKPTNGDKYSIGSWLTVPAENKDKNYYCKYEHESQQRSLSTQGIYYMLKIQFYMLL
uniref:Ig-like domain-containing protein n=1 Tax=Strix occidentalis caurina TaxID=311401 RepID=A0A8D0EVG7_STROC